MTVETKRTHIDLLADLAWVRECLRRYSEHEGTIQVLADYCRALRRREARLVEELREPERPAEVSENANL